MMAPIFIVLAAFFYSALHSWMASLSFKAWVQRTFGVAAQRGYRLFYNIFAGITFLPILGLVALLEDVLLYQISMPWAFIFIGGQTLGVIIVLLGLLQAGVWEFLGLRQLFGSQQAAQNQGIATDGIYGWVRHPLYTGGLLFLWFTPAMSLNLLTLYLILSLYFVVGARLEEKRLIHEFGDQYRNYQQTVPMLIPKFRLKN